MQGPGMRGSKTEGCRHTCRPAERVLSDREGETQGRHGPASSVCTSGPISHGGTQVWGQGTHTHIHTPSGAGEAAVRALPLGSEASVPAGWPGMRWGEGGAGS